MPTGRSILLSDTVGFISRLPTDLIAAFKSTLEEVHAADQRHVHEGRPVPGRDGEIEHGDEGERRAALSPGAGAGRRAQNWMSGLGQAARVSSKPSGVKSSMWTTASGHEKALAPT